MRMSRSLPPSCQRSTAGGLGDVAVELGGASRPARAPAQASPATVIDSGRRRSGDLWAGQVQAVLQMGLAVRDRCNAGELSEHGLASVRGRLVARLGVVQRWRIDATNWRAEQAIRPAVVIRKVCGGNRCSTLKRQPLTDAARLAAHAANKCRWRSIAVGPHRPIRQPGGTRCPAARTPFTPIGLTTVAHAAAPSPRISTVT